MINTVSKPSASQGHYTPAFASNISHLAWQTFKAFESAPDQVFLLFANDAQEARQLEDALRVFAPADKILLLADREILPYDHFSANADLVSLRLSALAQLSDFNEGFLIISLQNAMTRMVPQSFINHFSFQLRVGEHRPLERFVQQLSEAGYQRVSQVYEHGEFSLRGSLLDVFPMGSLQPLRIEWFDDEIETLRSFDPITQRTQEKMEGLSLLPAREFELTQASIDRFRQNYRVSFGDEASREAHFKSVSQGETFPGIEFYLPLFYDAGCVAFFDYLANKSIQLVRQTTAYPAAEAFYRDVKERYSLTKLDSRQSVLAPDSLFLTPEQLFSWAKTVPTILFADASQAPSPMQYLPDLRITQGESKLAALAQFCAQQAAPILLSAESLGRREFIAQLLNDAKIPYQSVNHFDDLPSNAQGVFLLTSGLEAGFIDPSSPLICITEQELFGQAKVRSREKSLARHEAFSESIRHIAELSIGDPVVHIEHGVGRYQGMERLDSGGIEREYIKLTYANDDSLYLPVEKLHLLSRYGGMADSAPLHRLGSGVWEKARSKASQKAHDVAAELLDIYARREEAKGEVYAIEETDYAAFASEFPFEETPDQETAIAAVIEDLRSTKPMDRLVCGDVGFGKTEVAMRAAFIAVQNKKQVAILVPTTLLANQHFKNFQDRFANWPITIAQLSRFTTGKDTQAHLEKLAKGEIDIVIGTHKLIQPSVKFKHLGLIILDEEHRFGVKQKETFKSLRAQVDILTMTATPIPRTLNMALSDLRALSIIATPPAKRTSVKTFVHEWNDAILVEACKREFYRGGQVYLLHNHVETIAAFADRISGLLPEAKIEIAHGQMPERELERIMQAFYHQKFNLLICTSIIETGIDNPNANTMIIDRADKFGLAQLHQLRGRVGRSWHQAYAWLFTPQAGAITKDAQRRLEVIARNDHLGAGFSLASHDLEIRGAGELLGDEQSGHIQEIGFGLYTQLLEEAVKAIRKGELPRDPLESLKEVCEVNLNESTLIPEDYLPDVGSRLMLYKRLAMLKDETALKDLQVEMIDRFGLFPEPVAHLVEQTRLRLRAQTLGIQKIEVGDQGALIQFNEKPNIDPLKIIQLLQSRSKTLQMKGPNRLRSQAPLANFAQKFEHIQSLLESLEG